MNSRHMALSTLLASLTIGAIACGGSGDDGTAGGAGALSAGSASTSTTAIVPGDYILDNGDVGATLTISSATTNSLAYGLGLLGKTGSQHNGELSGRTATRSGTLFVDPVDSDCRITVQSAGPDAVQLQQVGPCTDAGFGAFLDGTGKYQKRAATTTSGWVGLYETETTHRSWAIRVTAENSIAFRIVAGQHEDASERVDAKGLTGTLSGSTLSFRSGADCAIVIEKIETGLHVTQTGTCGVIGFPANEDLAMSDDQGADFDRLDENSECFEIEELAVLGAKGACKKPL